MKEIWLGRESIFSRKKEILALKDPIATELLICLIDNNLFTNSFFEPFLKPEDKNLKNNRRLARGALRYFLLNYYGIKDKLKRTEKGKLFVDKGLKFNLTHTNAMVGLIFSKNLEVGIDLEKPKKRNWRKIAQRMNFKAESEKDFYLIWTRKEAENKSWGNGIFTPSPFGRKVEDLELPNDYVGAISYEGTDVQERQIIWIK